MTVTWQVISADSEKCVVEYTDGTTLVELLFDLSEGVNSAGAFDRDFMKFQFIVMARSLSKTWNRAPIVKADLDALTALSGDENDQLPNQIDKGSINRIGPRAEVIG